LKTKQLDQLNKITAYFVLPILIFFLNRFVTSVDKLTVKTQNIENTVFINKTKINTLEDAVFKTIKKPL